MPPARRTGRCAAVPLHRWCIEMKRSSSVQAAMGTSRLVSRTTAAAGAPSPGREPATSSARLPAIDCFPFLGERCSWCWSTAPWRRPWSSSTTARTTRRPRRQAQRRARFRVRRAPGLPPSPGPRVRIMCRCGSMSTGRATAPRCGWRSHRLQLRRSGGDGLGPRAGQGDQHRGDCGSCNRRSSQNTAGMRIRGMAGRIGCIAQENHT